MEKIDLFLKIQQKLTKANEKEEEAVVQALHQAQAHVKGKGGEVQVPHQDQAYQLIHETGKSLLRIQKVLQTFS